MTFLVVEGKPLGANKTKVIKIKIKQKATLAKRTREPFKSNVRHGNVQPVVLIRRKKTYPSNTSCTKHQ